MKRSKVGFVVFGVHKDGLMDPMGKPFIDSDIIQKSMESLKRKGLTIVEADIIIATKAEAFSVLGKMKNDDSIDALVLFAGTWVWSANLIAAIRDFAKTGKGITIWTHPGSQGWRPVGGLVLNAALKEIGINHKFVYCAWDDNQVNDIFCYCKASTLKRQLEHSTVCSFGGRGMGQTCGVADPSQWMKVFGIDIDSRDTSMLLDTAKKFLDDEVELFRNSLTKWFNEIPADNEITNRSIRIYLALVKLKKEWDFSYYTIQSFPGLADDYAATCFAQSMMLENGIATSTLSDFNTLMCSILLTEFGDERMYYGDIQHIDKSQSEIKIIGDGAIPPSLAGEYCKGKASFAQHGIETEGSAGGLSISLVAKAGRGVLARLGRQNGKFVLTLAKCEVFEPDHDIIEARKSECGIPFWPHAFVKVSCDIEKLLENWNSEYACLGYGENLFQTIIYFCEQCGIEVYIP